MDVLLDPFEREVHVVKTRIYRPKVGNFGRRPKTKDTKAVLDGNKHEIASYSLRHIRKVEAASRAYSVASAICTE